MCRQSIFGDPLAPLGYGSKGGGLPEPPRPTHSLIPIPTKAITEAVAPVIKPIQMTSGEGKQVSHLFGRLRKTRDGWLLTVGGFFLCVIHGFQYHSGGFPQFFSRTPKFLCNPLT